MDEGTGTRDDGWTSCPAAVRDPVLSTLRFARCRFTLRALSPLYLPPYKGSTMRGGFGTALKDAVCVVSHRECGRCLLRERCAYSYLFETPVPAGSNRMRHYEHAPHPFVIEPPLDARREYAPGEHLDFGLVLIGSAIEYLPYVILAFERLGQTTGIGGGRQGAIAGVKAGAFSVESVAVADAVGTLQTVYHAEHGRLTSATPTQALAGVVGLAASKAPATLTFLTPTRLVFERGLVQTPALHIIVRSLLRRVASLAYFHAGLELALDYAGLVEAARAVRLRENRTRWLDWERFSGRQGRRVAMGGLVGQAVYHPVPAELYPLLRLGEILHVGKGTVFGLGQYRMERAIEADTADTEHRHRAPDSAFGAGVSKSGGERG